MLKDIAYKILDVLMLGRGIKVNISGIELRLPTRYYKYYEKQYEKDSIMRMRKLIQPKETVLDIGAQMGLMTKLFSDLVGLEGKVYSFEPTPSTYRLLQKTISINHLSQVVSVNKAVAEKEGKTNFNIFETEASAGNSLAINTSKLQTKAIEVDLISVDGFVSEKPIDKVEFIKIDTEGAELAVLKGAEKTIQRDRPNILLALHPKMLNNLGDSLEDVFDLCAAHRYNISYHGQSMAKNEFIAKENLFDVFLLPQ